MRGSSPRMTPECVARSLCIRLSPIQFSNSQRSALPILSGAGHAVFLFRAPRKPRGWSTEWRTSLSSCRVPFWRTRAPLGAPSRRFLLPGSAFPGTRLVKPVPSPAGSLRRGRIAPRSGPGASRMRGCEPRARAPHPLPPAMTPHESALGGGDKGDYNPIGINVKGRSPQPYPPSS